MVIKFFKNDLKTFFYNKASYNNNITSFFHDILSLFKFSYECQTTVNL